MLILRIRHAPGFFNHGSAVNFVAGSLTSGVHISEKYACMIAQIIVNMAVCLIIPNVLNVIIFSRTLEFKNLLAAARSFLRRPKR